MFQDFCIVHAVLAVTLTFKRTPPIYGLKEMESGGSVNPISCYLVSWPLRYGMKFN
jgi:hypothetical protein